ncbi:flagellar biosynthesis anti-sigma factor FlgM [Evansella sp. AB-rgal1]|uniref:flagellar biosynthesis anti-sigma factor FlgM n=1 Tax=Evansella sp. AB-rgal1 TaxID=3242696 RepID=UPI00359E4DBF
MKINPIYSLNAYRKQQEVSSKKSTELQKKHDQLEISSAAQNMQKVNQYAIDRQEKIEKIKDQIEQGTYKANAHETARKFYEYWNE